MSLINQMLKDLEQRGGRVANAEMTVTPKLSTVAAAQPGQMPSVNLRLPLIKAGGIMVLLAGGAYLWMQSTLAQSHSSDMDKVITANIKPKPITRAVSLTTLGPANTPSAPAIEAVTEQAAIFESRPLFESRLKYNPPVTEAVDAKAPKEKVIANLIPETSTMKSLPPKQPFESPVSDSAEKLLIPEPIVKPMTKQNTDNATIGKQIRPDQKSENYYRQALSYLQQGRVSEAQASLTLALETNPTNQEARQTLAGLLLDNKRYDDAGATLAAGLAITPEQNDFRMTLARLQVEAGDSAGALSTLEQGLSYAKNHADYQSFLATLLQRANRHEEAISHYTTALSLNPSASNSATTSTLIGLGISLQAVGKLEKSQEAFAHVKSSATLSPELSQFVEQRIKQINQRLQN